MPIAEDSGPRLITQAELLANAADVDGPSLTAIGLVISSGSGTLLDNGNGTWTYTPAANDDTGVSFSYTITDGSLSVPGTATLDITPVNDAPTTSPVTLVPIAEDSGPRLITQAELLANAADVDGPSLTAIGLAISFGSGTLVDNGNGTWTYTPAANDDTGVSFSYSVTDGSLSVPGAATLDITPVNDAPTTSPVTLVPIAEDSGPRLITQAELLANASDVDGPSLTAIGLAISSGSGTLDRQRRRDLDLHPGCERRHRRQLQLHRHRRQPERAGHRHARHHAGQRCTDDVAGDPRADRRRQRVTSDHAGRSAGQRLGCGRSRP